MFIIIMFNPFSPRKHVGLPQSRSEIFLGVSSGGYCSCQMIIFINLYPFSHSCSPCLSVLRISCCFAAVEQLTRTKERCSSLIVSQKYSSNVTIQNRKNIIVPSIVFSSLCCLLTCFMMSLFFLADTEAPVLGLLL